MNPLVALHRIREDGFRIAWERMRYRFRGRTRRLEALRTIAQQGRDGTPIEPAFARALGVREDELAQRVAELDAELCARGMAGSDGGAIAQGLRESMPDVVTGVVARADAIAAGDMRWLAPGLPDFQGNIDWHVAVGGARDNRWPIVPIDQIQEADEESPGDIRRTWELSRHQYLPLLSMAWLFTGETRHLTALVDIWRAWMEANPFGKGIHWLHAQEAALRMKAWIWARGLAGAAMPWTPTDEIRFHANLWAHAEHAWNTRSASPDRNNHALTELLALDSYCAAMPSAPLAKRSGQAIHGAASEEILRQFWENGAPGEGSVGYHLFTLESATEWCAHRDALDLPTSPSVKQRLSAMTEFAVAMMRSDGSWPRIGDVDDGRGFLLQHDPGDRMGAVTAACLLFEVDPPPESADCAESSWLGIEASVPASVEPSRNAQQHFVEAGFSIERSSGEHACHLVVSAGPSAFRPGVSLAHMHADGPSMTWWIDGRPILIDPGTGMYGGPLSRRTLFRQTAAHSTIEVDGADRFDVTSSRFGVERPPAAAPMTITSGSGWSLHESNVSAARSGQAAEVMLTRWVVHLPSLPALLIIDRARGAGTHTIRRHLHLGDTHLELQKDRAVLRDSEGVSLLDVHARSPASLQRKSSPRSPRYGIVDTGDSLCFEEEDVALPWVGAILLGPPGFTWNWVNGERCSLALEGGRMIHIHLQDWRPIAVEWEATD